MSAYLPWVTDAVDTYFTGLSLKAMLLTADYDYDPLHEFRVDVLAFEAAGTGYTAGGVAVTSVGVVQDDVGALVKLDFADVDFGALEADVVFVAIAVYVDTGDEDTDTLLGVDTFGETSTDGSTFTYIVGDDGFIALEV